MYNEEYEISAGDYNIILRIEPPGFTCFLSRSCRGDVIKGSDEGGKSDCCIAGGGLSFKNAMDQPCQECFSMIMISSDVLYSQAQCLRAISFRYK